MTEGIEIVGARERPYDMRWGTPEQVRRAFGISVHALKTAWLRGWVRARQVNWERDEQRTQTLYCFEDIHGFLERVTHRVSQGYAERWWTNGKVAALAARVPEGPYAGLRGGGGGEGSPRAGQEGDLSENKNNKEKKR